MGRILYRLLNGAPGRVAALGLLLGGASVAAVLATASGAPASDGGDSPLAVSEGVAGPASESEPFERFTPRGILTYTRDGEVVSVRADRPTWRVAAPERSYGEAYAVPDYGETATETYPSPNGQLTARIHRDEMGVRLHVTSGDALMFTLGLAGPSDPELRGDKELAAAVDGVPLVAAWSPDSRYLAVGSVTDQPWALNVISAGGSWSVERHEVLGGYIGELAWSPDGRTLAISTYELDLTDHTVILFDPADRSMQALVRGCSIVWSPDGQYLALRREPNDVPGLWIASVDGSALSLVADGDDAFPLAWTPAE